MLDISDFVQCNLSEGHEGQLFSIKKLNEVLGSLKLSMWFDEGRFFQVVYDKGRYFFIDSPLSFVIVHSEGETHSCIGSVSWYGKSIHLKEYLNEQTIHDLIKVVTEFGFQVKFVKK